MLFVHSENESPLLAVAAFIFQQNPTPSRSRNNQNRRKEKQLNNSPQRPHKAPISPVARASLRNNFEQVFRVLLDGGGDVSHADGAGRTPAMAAALIGDRSLLRFLADSESGADLSLRNSDGRTAAFFAAMNGHTGSLAFILGDHDYDAGGGGVSGIGRERETEKTAPTAARSGGGRGGGVSVVADSTADAADKIGGTPLWTAAAHGHLDTVKYLIDRHGASPNARDVTGTTAAWMAVREGGREGLYIRTYP